MYTIFERSCSNVFCEELELKFVWVQLGDAVAVWYKRLPPFCSPTLPFYS